LGGRQQVFVTVVEQAGQEVAAVVAVMVVGLLPTDAGVDHRQAVGATDGALTVTNLCAEARVSRASHYRSPVAAVVKTLLASDQTPRPEVEQLRWLTAPDGRAACRAVNSEDC
jgi:hypothetical protein